MKTLYNGSFIQVTEKEIDGYRWEQVHLRDSCMIIPENESGEVLLVLEKRPHETPNQRLKFVTGLIDDGEDVIQSANRELQEEAGFKAEHFEELLLVNSTGTVNSKFYCLKATGLKPSKLPNPDGEDTIISVKWYKPLEILDMLQSGTIPWSLSALGYYQYLNKNGYLLHS
jgi:8-oxo-dGTP pyrophosphatase MutT (NUDIX family)